MRTREECVESWVDASKEQERALYFELLLDIRDLLKK